MMTRRSSLALVAGTAVLIASWFFFLWGPEKNSYKSAKTELSELEQQHASLQEQVDMLGKLDEKKLQKGVDALNAAIPAKSDLNTFYHDTQDSANATGVQLTSVSATKPSAQVAKTTGIKPPPAGVTAISVNVTFTGSYSQASAFIDALDAMPRLVIIDSVSLTVDPTTGNLNAQLSLRIFTKQSLTTTTTVPVATTSESK